MELPEQSQLTLWKNYCDKKVEGEDLRELLKEASILLVSGTEEHCVQLSDKIIKALEDERNEVT